MSDSTAPLKTAPGGVDQVLNEAKEHRQTTRAINAEPVRSLLFRASPTNPTLQEPEPLLSAPLEAGIDIAGGVEHVLPDAALGKPTLP